MICFRSGGIDRLGLLGRSPPASPGGREGGSPRRGFRGEGNGVELPQLGGVWGGSPMFLAGWSTWRFASLHAGDGKLEFDLQLPDERGEFACNGNNGFVLIFATGLEFDVAFVKAVLHAPGECFDSITLSDLPGGEPAADLRGFSVMLGAFHEHPATVAVAAFGDGALAVLGTTGVFSGDKSEKAHESAGMLKAA